MGYFTTLSVVTLHNVERQDDRWVTNWEDVEELVVAPSRYYPGLCLEGLVRTTRTFRQDSLDPGRESNQILPKYNSRASTLSQTIWLMLILPLDIRIACCQRFWVTFCLRLQSQNVFFSFDNMSHRFGWDVQGIWCAWDRRGMHQEFWWESQKKGDH
jgi:hypothetical protein